MIVLILEQLVKLFQLINANCNDRPKQIRHLFIVVVVLVRRCAVVVVKIIVHRNLFVAAIYNGVCLSS